MVGYLLRCNSSLVQFVVINDQLFARIAFQGEAHGFVAACWIEELFKLGGIVLRDDDFGGRHLGWFDAVVNGIYVCRANQILVAGPKHVVKDGKFLTEHVGDE